MRVYLGLDDTDTKDSNRGTGKLARWFQNALPDTCRIWGVVRQQLLVSPEIPFTSHNSSACIIIEMPEDFPLQSLIERAVAHIEEYFLIGSDPGLCVVCEDDPSLPGLMEFGRTCTARVVTQKQALETAARVHLSGHGGTEDGIIGAAAAVGLTASGWYGRFIEFGGLRQLQDILPVSELENRGMRVVSIDRDAKAPTPQDLVLTKNWIRPMLWGGNPVVVLKEKEKGVWESLGEKRYKKTNYEKMTSYGG